MTQQTEKTHGKKKTFFQRMTEKFTRSPFMRKGLTTLALVSSFAVADNKVNAAISPMDVPTLNEWQAGNFEAGNIVRPSRVGNGIVSPYKDSKIQEIIDLVMYNTEYDAYFEEASLATGIPAIYLKIKCAAESQLKPGAKSPTGPVGIAQFTKNTARYCGLQVGNGIDERRDPRKAIMASALYTAHNLGRSNGNFFTVRENGKTTYGAMARYYGIVKNGDWKQYEANLKAVYDYFGVSHTLNQDEILVVKQNMKTNKLQPQEPEAFYIANVEKHNTKKKNNLHELYQQDMLAHVNDGPNQADLDAFALTQKPVVLLTDNVVVASNVATSQMETVPASVDKVETVKTAEPQERKKRDGLMRNLFTQNDISVTGLYAKLEGVFTKPKLQDKNKTEKQDMRTRFADNQNLMSKPAAQNVHATTNQPVVYKYIYRG